MAIIIIKQCIEFMIISKNPAIPCGNTRHKITISILTKTNKYLKVNLNTNLQLGLLHQIISGKNIFWIQFLFGGKKQFNSNIRYGTRIPFLPQFPDAVMVRYATTARDYFIPGTRLDVVVDLHRIRNVRVVEPEVEIYHASGIVSLRYPGVYHEVSDRTFATFFCHGSFDIFH